MADNISVNITADATQLRAKLALAQADLRAYAAEVRKAATDVRQSGNAATAEQVQALEKASASYNAARAAVQQHSMAMAAQKTAVSATTAVVKEATHATTNHGAASEAMVLVHEAMSGRFTKMSGSLMILTQRIGRASLAMMGLADVFGITSMSALHLVEWLGKVHDAKLLAEAGGIGSGVSNADLDAQVKKLANIGDTGYEAAGKVVHAFAAMAGTSKPVIDELTSGVRQLAARMGHDVPQAATRIVEAWNLNERAGAELLENTRSSTDAIRAFVKAAQDNDAIKARSILLQELSRSAREVSTETIMANRTNTEMNASMAAARAAKMPQNSASAAMLRAPIVDTAAVKAAETLNSALAAVNDQQKLPPPGTWSQLMTEQLHQVTFEAQKAAREQGKDWHATHQVMTQATVDFWQRTVATTKDGTKQRGEAEDKLIQAQEARDMLTQRLDEKSAKETLQTRLAALAQEVAANRENVGLVQQLETQKLALIRAAEGENSKLYQEELRTQTQVVRAAVAEQVREIASAGRENVATARAVAMQEIAARSGARAAILADLALQERAIDDAELSQLDNLIASLAKGTAAEREATRAREKLARDLSTKQIEEQARVTAAAWAAAEAQTRVYRSAFDGIASAGRSTMMGLITGTETWQRAEQRIAGSVLDGFGNMAMHIVGKWLATQLTMDATSVGHTAVRAAIERGDSGFSEMIMAKLAGWLGMETSKTAGTAGAVGIREGVEADGAIASAIASKASALSSIEANAAVAASGAYAAIALIPYVGPALAPAAAATAFVGASAYSTALAMPSFAVGAWELPGDMVANVHKGEMIIPAGPAAALRDGLSGGGGGRGGDTHVHFNVTAPDAGGVQAFFNQHAATIAKTVARYAGNNPSARPAY